MIRVQVEVPVYPTENPEKVRRALSNIIFGLNFSEKVEDGVKYFVGVSEGLDSLSQIKRHIKDQGISGFVRQALSKSVVKENKIRFYLNKQAAFMGVAHFCDTKNESPLGPITIEIESDDLNSVIDYVSL